MTEVQAKPGRPPDPEAANRLKQAALQLVRSEGYAQVTITRIIKAAGVSRQTLYNRWTSKAELVMEAFRDMAREEVPMPDNGDLHQALADFLTLIFHHVSHDGDTLRNLIASAQADAAFREVFYRDFVGPREEIVTELLRRAAAAGQLRADPQTLSQMIHGAFWYRLLNGLPLTAETARALADMAFTPASAPAAN